jgi:peptidoglycan/xylan/chitin deacetylase (PgdA/CDA1 family)
MTEVLLHSVAAADPESALGRWLSRTSRPYGELLPLVGAFSRPIVRVSGPPDVLEQDARSLPEGAATPEAIAVRLRREGVPLSWGAPEVLPDAASFIRLCHARGASSVELARSDPSLVTELELGTFFHAYRRRHAFRHVAIAVGVARLLARFPAISIRFASDLAFWAGVRSTASDQEWDRFTQSSYVVLYYHRIGTDGWPGQEHLDLDERRFERQLRLLRWLGYRPLTPDELLTFHSDPTATLPRRRYLLTADDALRDAVLALGRHGATRPHVFVNTAVVGGSPWWAFGKSVATWDELKAFEEAGGVLGSHCRSHPRLPTLDVNALEDELSGSLDDLRARFPTAPPILAYPHGLHDEKVRAAAQEAGYAIAFTTEPGRNGAGIDPYCLRRLGIKNWDGPAAFLWKAVMGESLPRRWERLRARWVDTDVPPDDGPPPPATLDE